MQKRKGLADKLSAAVDEFVDVEEIVSNDDSNDISNSVSRNVSSDVSEINSKNVSLDVSKNVSSNIVIKKNPKQDESKRVSYYLKIKTIKQIEKLAKKNDMKISEFLQKLLDETLDKIKIEE